MKNELWKELANPNWQPSGLDRPSSVPEESRRGIRKHLRNVATEMVKSEVNPDDKDDGSASLPVFTRTQGEGYPAAWVGGGPHDGESFEGIVLCTNFFCLRDPLYLGSEEPEPWKQALVGLGDGDIVIHVEGDLPVEPGNEDIEVSARRVKDREEAASPDADGLEEFERPRWVFFNLLRKYPKIGKGLSSNGQSARCFVANGEESLQKKSCEGVIKKLSGDGYGFVESEDVREDIYARLEDVNGGKPSVGDEVSFDLVETVRGPRALNLELEENGREGGIVEWFSKRRGYGFIDRGNGEDAFVHETDVIDGPLSKGDSVEFQTEIGNEGPRAVNVQIR